MESDITFPLQKAINHIKQKRGKLVHQKNKSVPMIQYDTILDALSSKQNHAMQSLPKTLTQASLSPTGGRNSLEQTKNDWIKLSAMHTSSNSPKIKPKSSSRPKASGTGKMAATMKLSQRKTGRRDGYLKLIQDQHTNNTFEHDYVTITDNMNQVEASRKSNQQALIVIQGQQGSESKLEREERKSNAAIRESEKSHDISVFATPMTLSVEDDIVMRTEATELHTDAYPKRETFMESQMKLRSNLDLMEGKPENYVDSQQRTSKTISMTYSEDTQEAINGMRMQTQIQSPEEVLEGK